MVKIFILQFLLAVVLTASTFFYFTPKVYFRDCSLKILTYASFFEGAGKSIFENYEKEFLCRLQVQVLKTAGVFASVKDVEKHYDIIIGMDQYQLDEIKKEKYFVLQQDFTDSRLHIEHTEKFYNNNAFEIDGAPLTYFVRYKPIRIESSQAVPRNGVDPNIKAEDLEPEKFVSFYSFDDFLKYLKDYNMKIAIPSPNTSVLGSLYLNWMLEVYDGKNLSDFLKEKNWVYVSSWTEAFGLFEKNLVQGFLSFETSEMYFEGKKQKRPVAKVGIQKGHPNYREYMVVSNASKATKKNKYRFVNFMYEDSSQKILLEKNYMWPVNYVGIKEGDQTQANLKNFKTLKKYNLKNRLTKSELQKNWKELR